ncbi:uncharacterized protein LOC135464822 [Liolophura sinensis]|uniref:uncharacterized protein LOC135464822 n=1 Tax=Liolophura sinensis TaxID=3198878 RepID=UPI0031593765
MIKRHIPNPSDSEVMQALQREELALHCRRRTRGTDGTERLISKLISSMDGDKGLDILGVPLINTEKMRDIWQQQSRHVGCIQDPEAIQLYTCMGQKTGCLNQQRGDDPISYDGPLQQAVNKLSSEVLGKTFCPNFVPPKKYTGERLGLEYLFAQSSAQDLGYAEIAQALESDTAVSEEQPEALEEEGFVDAIEIEDVTVPMLDAMASEEQVQTGDITMGKLHFVLVFHQFFGRRDVAVEICWTFKF